MERDFFATAAQVVPLLALAGLVEARMSAGDGEPSWFDSIVRLFLFASLVLAEVAAFTALAGRPTATERQYVILGLVIGGMSLVARFADDALDELNEVIARPWLRLTIVLAWSIGVIGLLIVPGLLIVF